MKIPKKAMKSKGVPLLIVKSVMLIYQNVCINWTYINIVKSIYYQTQMMLIFVMYFSDIGQCFQPAQENVWKIKNLAPLGSTTIIYLMTVTDDDRQNSRIIDRQKFFRIVWNVLILYGPFGSRTFFFGNRKNKVIKKIESSRRLSRLSVKSSPKHLRIVWSLKSRSSSKNTQSSSSIFENSFGLWYTYKKYRTSP